MSARSKAERCSHEWLTREPGLHVCKRCGAIMAHGVIVTRPRTEAEVERRIEEWHQRERKWRDTGPPLVSLHESLGWTWEEYAAWVETGRLPSEAQREDDAREDGAPDGEETGR